MGNSVVWDFIGRNRLSRVGAQIRKTFRGIDKSATRTGRSIDFLARKLAKAGKGMALLGRMGKKLRGGPLGGLIGIGAAAVSGRELIRFEDAKLKALTNASSAAMRAQFDPIVDKKLREIRKFGIGTEEAGAAIFRQLSQRGMDPKELDRLDSAIKLSIGGFVELASATTAMNKAVAIWPDEMPERMAEKILAAQQLGDTDVAELARVIPIIGSSVRGLGFNADESLALLAAGSRILQDANKAAIGIVGIRTQFRQLKGDNLRKAVGLGLVDRRGNAVGAEELVRAFVRANADVRSKQKLKTIITGEEADKLVGIMDETFLAQFLAAKKAAATGTSLELAYQARLKSASTRWKQIINQFGDIGRDLATIVSPALGATADVMQIAAMETKAEKGGLMTFFGNVLKTGMNDAFFEPTRWFGQTPEDLGDPAENRKQRITSLRFREEFFAKWDAIIKIETDPGTTATVVEETTSGNVPAGVSVSEG